MMERVQQMIDNPGIYVISTVQLPEHLIVVVSQNGKLTAMSPDNELLPEHFNPGLVIRHGPLK